MNVFVLSLDPVQAAQDQCDKHVVKMATETAQILCTVAHAHGIPAPFLQTHPHHPSTVWAGESKQNAEWLLRHGLALCHEYTHRYRWIHDSEQAIHDLARARLPDYLLDIGQTPFALAMPDHYRVMDPVESYRRFYLGDKARFARWTHRQPPDWWLAGRPEPPEHWVGVSMKRITKCLSWGEEVRSGEWIEMGGSRVHLSLSVTKALCGRLFDQDDDLIYADILPWGTYEGKRPAHVCRQCWPVYRRDMQRVMRAEEEWNERQANLTAG